MLYLSIFKFINYPGIKITRQLKISLIENLCLIIPQKQNNKNINGYLKIKNVMFLSITGQAFTPEQSS
jgi:hypothetical protein